MSTQPELEHSDLTPGSRVGAYEIESMIGRGGMGAVYKARDIDRECYVALKTIDIAVGSDPAYAQRFKQEAQAASRVQGHPNIVTVHAYGTHEGKPYIVMEYVRGEGLDAIIARGPMAVGQAADVILPVCAAMYAVHSVGIVHRDLKPQNILIARGFAGPTPKILDFGIAKASGAANLTGEGDIIGTRLYLSPEQVTGQQLDARSDIFALGLILYECVTGRRPHDSKGLREYLEDLVSGHFARPSLLVPSLPPAFEAVILKAMQIEPRRRYDSAHDLGAALLPFGTLGTQRKWSEFYTEFDPVQYDPGISLPNQADSSSRRQIGANPEKKNRKPPAHANDRSSRVPTAVEAERGPRRRGPGILHGLALGGAAGALVVGAVYVVVVPRHQRQVEDSRSQSVAEPPVAVAPPPRSRPAIEHPPSASAPSTPPVAASQMTAAARAGDERRDRVRPRSRPVRVEKRTDGVRVEHFKDGSRVERYPDGRRVKFNRDGIPLLR